MPDPADRSDFPTARRGYDRAAVDAHLGRLRAEIERLRGEAGGAGASSAAATGEEVRSIVAAAEASGAEIRRNARAAAEAIREGAREDAARAREQVGRVREAATALLGHVEALEADLEAGLASLRLPAEGPAPRDEPAPADEPAPGHEPGRVEVSAAAEEPDRTEVSEAADEPGRAEVSAAADEPPPAQEPRADGASEAPAAGEAVKGAPGGGSANGAPAGDLAGARLVALQAALSGRPREEADAELEGMLEPAARARLLDEVYAKAAGG